MSSIYVIPVEIKDNAAPAETFWLEALLWVWDASQFWEIVRDDLESRNYQLVSFGEARFWHDERTLWPDSALIEQAVSKRSAKKELLWCENKVPIEE